MSLENNENHEKKLELHARMKKIIKFLKIISENHENHENHRISIENHEDQNKS